MTEAELKKEKSRQYQKTYQAKHQRKPNKKDEEAYANMSNDELFLKGFEDGYENG